MDMPAPSHNTHQRSRQGQHSTVVGMGVNLILIAVKAAAGIAGHSYALVADALESATDLVTSFFVWLGLRTAARQPDANHPYGHGKAEPLAALLVAMALVAAAILIAMQSVRMILTPHQQPHPYTLVVLAAVVLVKEVLFRWVVGVGKELKSSAVQADAWHHRADAITSGLAFVGITIALIGGPGYESADDWAALASSLLIGFNAWHIFRPALGEIMDEAPPGTWRQDIDAIAAAVPGVQSTEKCQVRKMGLELFVDIHVRVQAHLNVREGHTIAHAVKKAIQAQYPIVYDVLVHVEPTN